VPLKDLHESSKKLRLTSVEMDTIEFAIYGNVGDKCLGNKKKPLQID